MSTITFEEVKQIFEDAGSAFGDTEREALNAIRGMKTPQDWVGFSVVDRELLKDWAKAQKGGRMSSQEKLSAARSALDAVTKTAASFRTLKKWHPQGSGFIIVFSTELSSFSEVSLIAEIGKELEEELSRVADYAAGEFTIPKPQPAAVNVDVSPPTIFTTVLVRADPSTDSVKELLSDQDITQV